MANPKAREHVSTAAKKAFDDMDKDDSGFVNISEFIAYCKNVYGTDSGVAVIFNEVDTSDDFKISVQEIEDLLNGVAKGKIEEGHVKDVFNKTDTSKNGKLDKNEFRCLLEECGYCNEAIQATIDEVAGEDGQVTLAEFLDHWRHDD